MHKSFFASLLIASSVVVWSGCTSPDSEPVEEPAEIQEDLGTEQTGTEGLGTQELETEELGTEGLELEPLPGSNTTD